MDFYKISEKTVRKDVVEIYPDFKVCRSKDLMIRGRTFYAIWDEGKGLWSTDEYDVSSLVDEDINKYLESRKSQTDARLIPKYMSTFTSSNSWITQ